MKKSVEKVQPVFHEIFRGSYCFSHKNQVYAEENFKLFENPDNKTFTFVSEILTPIVEKSSLKILCYYTLAHNYNPIQLKVEKFKGDLYSKETFTPIPNHPNRMVYTFQSKENQKEIKIQTPHHYHLASPAISSALIIIKRKKYNPTISNNFYVITSKNIWDYSCPPENRLVYLKCNNIDEQEEVVIGDQVLTGARFEVSLENRAKKKKISYFISNYYAIPYQVTLDKDTQVDIKTFENLS